MTPDASALRRPALAALCLASLLAGGCAGLPKKKTPAASVDPRLATPPHNMSAYEYPFDDDGTYRRDWVTNKNATRDKPVAGRKAPARGAASATVVSAPAPPRQVPAATTPPPSPPRPATTSSPPATAAASAPPPPRPAASAPPKPPAPKPAARYHTVAAGDTLFSLSRRYSVTVAQLKSTNGLSGDLIRVGQSLRIP